MDAKTMERCESQVSEEKTKWNDCQTQAIFQVIKAGSFFMIV
jgi:hypothetical protein